MVKSMLVLLFGLKKFVPTDCYSDVFQIPYQKLYDQGKRVLLMDIDNTLIPYDAYEPYPKLKQLIAQIKAIGFKIIFMSNNKEPRVSHFANILGEDYVYSSMKPLKKGYRQALKKAMLPKKTALAIGDQLLTDVLGSNRFGIDVILVKPLKKHNELWFTKFNRKTEKRIIKKISRHYPDIYAKIKEVIQ
ncbi:MAG: haloacid dehalogenase-like hydrolase [Tenericutes bacterium ADurb.BinA124]|nr:MAG: haloacid dehalogenase-like hydrolase [Tenericutes bacterium ADurb.BinA124]